MRNNSSIFCNFSAEFSSSSQCCLVQLMAVEMSPRPMKFQEPYLNECCVLKKKLNECYYIGHLVLKSSLHKKVSIRYRYSVGPTV